MKVLLAEIALDVIGPKAPDHTQRGNCMTSKTRLTTVAAMCAAALTLAFSTASSTGTVSTGVTTDNGSVNATCAYTATLPSTNVNRTNVGIATSANTVAGEAGTNPVVATAVRCTLEGTDASGGAGITMFGPTATIAGEGEFHRLTTPKLCVSATASYLDGSTDTAPERCIDIDASVLIDPKKLEGITGSA